MKQKPSFSSISKSTKDEFEGSSSSIPPYPDPLPSPWESFSSPRLVRSFSFPTPLYHYQTSNSAWTSPPALQIPSAAANSKQDPSLAANTIARSRCWKTFLALLKRIYIKMRETDKKVELDQIHPILSCIEKYEISKNFLVGIGMSMEAGLMFSNSRRVMKTGVRIAACTLPVSFTTLLIGLLLRKTCKKSSFLFQLLGIGLGIFAMSASGFSFLTHEFKWIPVVTGLLCLIILIMPVPAIISYEKMICGKEKDLERGECDEIAKYFFMFSSVSGFVLASSFCYFAQSSLFVHDACASFWFCNAI